MTIKCVRNLGKMLREINREANKIQMKILSSNSLRSLVCFVRIPQTARVGGRASEYAWRKMGEKVRDNIFLF